MICKGDIILAKWCGETVRCIITHAVRRVSPDGRKSSFVYHAEDMTKTVYGIPYKYLIKDTDVLREEL